ncbi:MAG: signal peptide peptidase SppA [Deltaproteobacteria bacterium]|nr:signal peptide peptidase SppA [Deltaproteobacteria bacterium]
MGRGGTAALLAVALFLGGCAVIRVPMAPEPRVREVTVMGEGPDKVLLLEVSGVISFRRPWAPPGFPRPASLPARVRADLDRARKDLAIRAVVVRIDSPGGTVTASDVIHHEIRRFREERGVPVVAAIVEKGLSGGYYAALAADEIVAFPTALVGSVGVFVAKFDASGLLGKLGVRSELTKSGTQKDILSPLRPLTPAERQTLQGIVQDLTARFHEALRAARPRITEEDWERITSAAPFTASQALELRLVDRVGYLEDAFQAALTRAGLERARLVAYRRGEGTDPTPYGMTPWLLPAAAGPLALDPRWIEELLETEIGY